MSDDDDAVVLRAPPVYLMADGEIRDDYAGRALLDSDVARRKAAREIVASALEDIRGLHDALEEWDRAGRPAERAPFWLGHLYATGGRWRHKVLKFREEHFGDG